MLPSFAVLVLGGSVSIARFFQRRFGKKYFQFELETGTRNWKERRFILRSFLFVSTSRLTV